MEGNRYSRQYAIPGWKSIQGKLESSKVLIVGAGSLGTFVALPLACMGVGRKQFGGIKIYDNATIQEDVSEFLYAPEDIGEYKSKILKRELSEINPHVGIKDKKIKLTSRYTTSRYDLVIDCTQDKNTTSDLAAWSAKTGIPVISGRTNGTRGEIYIFPSKQKYRFMDFERKKALPTTTMIIGGTIAEEARIILAPLNENEYNNRLRTRMIYDATASQRFSFGPDIPRGYKLRKMRNLKVKMIGAGGTGTYAGLALTILGINDFTIVDMDKSEITNLNRQFMFFDKLGEYKAPALANSLRKINPDSKIEDEVLEIKKVDDIGNDVDLLISAVDNDIPRVVMNDWCIEKNKPSVSGATSEFGGQVNAHVPGKYPCMTCQLGINEKSLEKTREYLKRKETHCLEDPSVAPPTQIIGGVMAEKVRKILSGEDVTTQWNYDHKSKGIFYLLEPSMQLGCRCL